MYQRIIVGTDGSLASRKGSIHAARLAEVMGATITVAAVAVEHGTPTSEWSDEPRERPIRPEIAEQWARAEAAWFSEQGVDAETKVLEGHAAEALAREATPGSYDLLIVGHRGAWAGRAPRLGSVAEELVRLAPCPILVVP